MPNFMSIESGLKLIPVDFAEQVRPGTVEYALCHLVDKESICVAVVRVSAHDYLRK